MINACNGCCCGNVYAASIGRLMKEEPWKLECFFESISFGIKPHYVFWNFHWNFEMKKTFYRLFQLPFFEISETIGDKVFRVINHTYVFSNWTLYFYALLSLFLFRFLIIYKYAFFTRKTWMNDNFLEHFVYMAFESYDFIIII